MSSFDPYLTWFDISQDDRPIDHYQLLGLEMFEDSQTKIEDAVAQRAEVLQAFSMGEHVVEAQRILNEVAMARICLVDESQKADYDAGLREQIGSAAGDGVRASSWSAMVAMGTCVCVLIAGIVFWLLSSGNPLVIGDGKDGKEIGNDLPNLSTVIDTSTAAQGGDIPNKRKKHSDRNKSKKAGHPKVKQKKEGSLKPQEQAVPVAEQPDTNASSLPVNLALRAKVKASSNFENFLPEYVQDEKLSDESRWQTVEKKNNAWLEMQLESEQRIGGFHMYSGFNQQRPVKKLDVRFEQGGKWVPIASSKIRNSRKSALRLEFDKDFNVTTSKLRFVFGMKPKVREIKVWPYSENGIPELE